jgi:hypothetical protein
VHFDLLQQQQLLLHLLLLLLLQRRSPCQAKPTCCEEPTWKTMIAGSKQMLDGSCLLAAAAALGPHKAL